MSIRVKTILGIALIEALLLLLLITMALNYLRSTNYEGLSKRAETTAMLFATTTKDAVLSYDLASLESFADEVMLNSDLVYARVLGPQGEVFVSAGDQHALSVNFRADRLVEEVHDGVFDTYAEIKEGGRVYGRVEVGLGIQTLTKTIAQAQRSSALVALMEMVLVALFSFLLGAYLTRQLKGLTDAAQKIASGDLNVTVPVKGKDEIAEVATAFNAMASNLQEVSRRRDEVEEQLNELNRSLEARVEHRTSQLEEKNQELEKANRDIKDAQAKLVHTEKLASIGTLAAGVAHEINNPLGFVISNLGTLKIYSDAYREMLAEYQQLSGLTDITERDEQLEKIRMLERTHDLEFMESDLDSLLSDTQEGSVRVKEIVKGLKEFSHVDQSEEFHMADINQCIESTLKVVHNELKYHCEVKTDLQPVPQTCCAAGQLKQVLLNILLNAGHAIKERGTILVTSQQVDGMIEVNIQDDGEGIPESLMDKLFDPFFTTKKVGEGTGLGLAISYGIMEEHGGGIRVESVAGEGSCFTLFMPVKSC